MYKLKFYIPLIIAGAMLLAVTIPIIGLPYCNSEAQLLGDSIFYMKNHGMGMVFNGESVELPDLFSVIFYLIARFISPSPIVMHLFAMTFSALSIVIAYKFGKFFFSVQAGVIASSIMIVQNIFLAQSGLVLPTMMLNVCILGGMFFFYREKYHASTALMCIAALTDITGLLVSVFFLVAYYRIKYKEWTMRHNLMMALPIALWFVYQAISLSVCGQFSGRSCEFSMRNFVENAWFIFVAQHRWAMTAVLLSVLAVNTVNKNMLYFVKELAWSGAAVLIVLMVTNSIHTSEQSWNLTPISIMAIYTGCAISTLHTSYYSKYIVACAVIAASALSVTQRDSVSDAYVNYKSKVKVDIKTAELIKSKVNSNETILCDKYFNHYLTDKDFGYIDGTIIYKCVDGNSYTPAIKWSIYSSDTQDTLTQLIREDPEFEKRNAIYIGNCTNEIYQKKDK